MFEVHISKHSLFRLKITVGCLTSTYPSIHFETPSRSRSVVWCVVWCVWRVWCVVFCVCVHVLWWRVCCVVCGEAWHALSLPSLSCSLSLFPALSPSLLSIFLLLLFPFFSLIFLFLSSFSFSFALAPSLALALSLALSLSLLSSLLTTKTLSQEPINQHGGQHRGI